MSNPQDKNKTTESDFSAQHSDAFTPPAVTRLDLSAFASTHYNHPQKAHTHPTRPTATAVSVLSADKASWHSWRQNARNHPSYWLTFIALWLFAACVYFVLPKWLSFLQPSSPLIQSRTGPQAQIAHITWHALALQEDILPGGAIGWYIRASLQKEANTPDSFSDAHLCVIATLKNNRNEVLYVQQQPIAAAQDIAFWIKPVFVKNWPSQAILELILDGCSAAL